MAEPSTFISLKSVRQSELKSPIGLPILAVNDNSTEFHWIGHSNTKAPELTADPRLFGNLRLLHSHALTLLFLHEISHIIDGHIEFCRDAKLKARTMRRGVRKQFLARELQPLEFLADQRALSLASAHILASLEASLDDLPIERKRAAAIEHLTMFGMAAGIVSLLYEHYSNHVYSHPPASHRALYLQASVHIEAPTFELVSNDVQSALNDGISQSACGWDALGWPRNRELPDNVDLFLAPLMNVSSRCKPPEPPAPITV